MDPERKFSETSRNKNEAIPQGNFPSNLLFLTDSVLKEIELLIQSGNNPENKLLLISKDHN